MKKQMRFDKLFIFLYIMGIMIIAVILSMFVRRSITVYEFTNIIKNSHELEYTPFLDTLYSNGSFVDNADNFKIIEDSDYIVIGSATDNREVLEDAVKTRIIVKSVVKGEINEKMLDIYEPVAIRNNYYQLFTTYDGYNLIQDGRNYIFCLKKLENNVYMYITPLYGKFLLDYEEKDFLIVDKRMFDLQEIYYDEFMQYEQLFASDDSYLSYVSKYKELMEFLN